MLEVRLMTASERILQLLDEQKMTQKEFAKLTGIPESTVSDWKKKKTNPSSDKIMIICQVLNVTPEWLLSGIEEDGSRSNKNNYYVIDRNSDVGEIVEAFGNMDATQRSRFAGYVKALLDMGKD